MVDLKRVVLKDRRNLKVSPGKSFFNKNNRLSERFKNNINGDGFELLRKIFILIAYLVYALKPYMFAS